LLISSAENILVWGGRDWTLTGRTLIWQETWELLQRRPLLGYGYGAFWAEDSEVASRVQEGVGWETPSAHNGYLDLLLELGVIGLAFFGLSTCTTILRMFANAWSIHWTLLLSWCALLSFVLIYNLVESAMLQQNHLLTFLYVWVATVARGGYLENRRESLAEWR
jgi:O-antigen ligase